MQNTKNYSAALCSSDWVYDRDVDIHTHMVANTHFYGVAKEKDNLRND